MNLREQQTRAKQARAYTRALKAESLAILEALKLLTVERPTYGDGRLAYDLGVVPGRISRIREAHGLEWQPGAPTRQPRPLQRQRSREEVQRVLDTLRANGGNVKRTARETGVPQNTVRRWRNGETKLSAELA